MLRSLILSVITLLTTSFAASAQSSPSQESQAGSPQKHRIVMQLSGNDTLLWKGLMNNLKNLKAGWGDNVEIEVVTHGPGIQMLMKANTTQQEKIAHFKKMGVVFVVCENTMREKNVTKDQLIPEAGTVKMGVGEVVMKQEQGWSYIKVGF